MATRWSTAILAGLLICGMWTQAMAFELQSPAFAADADIPVQYTCDGKNLSPPLRWTDAPATTKSFALIADDPDAPAGTWVHWVLYATPATARGLSEGVPPRDMVSGVGTQGVNDFGKVGYGGPCPPRGPAHRYFFRLYALDIRVDVPPGKTKAEVLTAIEGHVLGQAELKGRYKRR